MAQVIRPPSGPRHATNGRSSLKDAAAGRPPSALKNGRVSLTNGIKFDADSIILKAITGLCTQGVPTEKVEYFQSNVYDLIRRMVEFIIETVPDCVEAALVVWLLENGSAPEELLKKARSWTGPNKKAAESKPMKSALKISSAIVTPAGTYLSEEEERLRYAVDLSDQQRMMLIKGVPMFKGLSESDLDTLNKVLDVETFLEGETMVRHGDVNRGIHIVASGEAKILVSNEAGTVTAGDIVGANELLQGTPLQETFEATSAVTTLHLDALAFKALGLKKKIATMHRKKGMKARDDTQYGGRRASACGHKNLITQLEDMSMIQDAIRQNMNLKEVLNLSEEQIQHVCKEAYLQNYKQGDVIFKKGDHGHRFYVVNSGVFEVTDATMVTERMSSAGTLKLRMGDSFGELALLYNAPRAATVQCSRPGSLWVMSRTTLKNSMRLRMDARILQYSELIANVDIFKNKDAGSMANVCNALEERYFIKNEVVVEEGVIADMFFIIYEGHCQVVSQGKDIKTLGPGDFFGERGLIEESVRLATVKVNSDHCTCLALDRVAFELMLGEDDRSAWRWDVESEPDSPLSPRSPRPKRKGNKPTRSAMANTAASCHYAQKLKTRLEDPDAQAHKPERIPRSQLETIGVLGQGSFGFVTLERDKKTGSLYALKAMSKTKIMEESLKDAVANEKACMELLSSPFVVQLLATYRDASKVYLLIEPCFGGELFEVFSDNSDLFSSSVHAQFYAACAALGLEHMHSRRIVYRDLKLENCLLTTNGYLKLTDLGISKVCIGKTYTVCGTTDYFAPETLRQTGHNRAVDWWALGVMIYMMMTGRSPFEAPDTMKTYRKIISGFAKVQFPNDFPQQCSGMIKALCQKNPEERLTMGSLGIQNFKDHPWYRGFVWRSLEARTMTAPWTPGVDEAKIVAKVTSKKPEKVEDEQVEEMDGLTADWDDQFDMDLADTIKAAQKS